jgi:Tfp pilus assembly protein PilV
MGKTIKNIRGLSLIEALVCLVIVGIGFIGVNQMISYATSSMDRSLEANKINFLSETAVEDIMGDTNNASNYNFTQSCTKSSYGASDLSSKKKTKWAKLFLAENQIKINNKDRKISCVSGDSKSATISSGSDRTSAKFSFKSNQGKKKKFIGVVVK